MAIRVQIQGRGQVAEFPDGTDPAVIDTAIKRDYFSADTSPSPFANLDTIPAHRPGQAVTTGQKLKAVRKAVMPYVRPVLEGGGATLGAIAGSGTGGLAGLAGGPAAPGTVPYGAITGGVTGAGLGYAMGKKLSDIAEGTPAPQRINADKPPTFGSQLANEMLQSGIDVGTGMLYDMGGQASVPVVKGLASLTGKVVKPILGRLSGTGTAAINESISSGMKPTTSKNPLKSITTYDKALRGEIKGEDIVDTARTALTRLKDARGTAYQTQLQTISQNQLPIDTAPIDQEIASLMSKYNVKINPQTGKIDTSRIAMGKTGRNDIEEIIDTVSGWGSQPADKTAVGLDTLKRQLDDFYSDSSQARQFVAQLRNKVKDVIVDAVPQYGEMTKGYAEATKIIKDVEAGLMLRKQGMSGRIVADQTLRRLMSSMRDNFALRKELVDILGNKGGADLGEAIAGYTQNSVVPAGLAGTGPALIGSAALAKFFDPSFASVIVASSPRVQGEFFRMLGKGMKTVKAVGTPAQRGIIRQTAIQADE